MKTFWIFFSAAMFAISGRASEWPGELRPVNGALTLHIDGKAVNASAFRWLTSFGSLDRLYHQEKNAPMAQFAQTRVPVIIIQIDIGWKGPDKYDYSEVDKVLKKLFKEKYEGPIEPIDKNIQKLMAKEKRTANDEVMLGVFMLQRQRYIKARANYVRDLIKANPTQELSLILLQDELQDSTDLQKRLFKAIKVVNKESNLYKTTAEKMQ